MEGEWACEFQIIPFGRYPLDTARCVPRWQSVYAKTDCQPRESDSGIDAMNRKHQQAELLFQLGQLMGPPLKMAEMPNQYDRDERTRIMARYNVEMDLLLQATHSFCIGEAGHSYYTQFIKVQDGLYAMKSIQAGSAELNDATFCNLVMRTAPLLRDVILSIPVPVDSTIYEARTPFSTYCFVKDQCSTVKQDIVWLDRYFDQTIFHRFFSETTNSVRITLITLPFSATRGKADEQRHNEFMDVSKLFAQERGPIGYRLIHNGTFHDRWLRCDDRLFVLGGSIKDLAKPFTISRLDSQPENVKHFDDTITRSVEVFGPTQTAHP